MSFAWADLIVFSAFMAATKDQVLFSYLLYKTQYSREKIIVRILPWEGCKKKKLKKLVLFSLSYASFNKLNHVLICKDI